MPACASVWDYIIVGSGSAGGVLAARLSEDPAVRVLLLEAGGWDRNPVIHIPGFVYEAIRNPRLNWRYPGAGDQTLGGRKLEWAAGRVIGGSSSINGMVFVRGLPADFDGWRDQGNAGWGWQDVLPYFRRSETWHGAPDPGRGTDGPIHVGTFLEPSAACLAVLDGFVATGTPYVSDYNAGITSGVGLTQTNQRAGLRLGVAGAYLRPARARPNLTILTHAMVQRVVLEGQRCIGVEITSRSGTTTLRALREVILSAGALASPAILLRSGIGEPAVLAQAGVSTVHALAGVGENLHEHVNAQVSAQVTVRTYDSLRSGRRRVGAGLRWLRDRDGPARSPANHLQAFVRADLARGSADIQVQTSPVSSFEPRRDGVQGVTSVVSLCQPQSRGRIRLHPGEPMALPQVETSLLGMAEDRTTLLAGLRHVREVLRIGPGGAFGERELAPGMAVQSDEDWLAYLRRTAGLNWHPVGTCRMGSGTMDVVDAQLRVHGIAGLRVADASIMPTVPSGNTNAVTIMIGEKAADLVQGRTG